MYLQITRADVDVQPYAFTTKSLFVGHMDYKYLRWQVSVHKHVFLDFWCKSSPGLVLVVIRNISLKFTYPHIPWIISFNCNGLGMMDLFSWFSKSRNQLFQQMYVEKWSLFNWFWIAAIYCSSMWSWRDTFIEWWM